MWFLTHRCCYLTFSVAAAKMLLFSKDLFYILIQVPITVVNSVFHDSFLTRLMKILPVFMSNWQVGAEIPMDSSEADEENKQVSGKTLLYVLERG
jgi:hypothetical protein